MQGSFQLYIAVQDNDLNADDFIGHVFVDAAINTSDSFLGFFNFESENTHFTLDLSFRVTCQRDFYGADCATFCQARDDSAGHYTCDALTGRRICLPGYQNVSSSCTQRKYAQLDEYLGVFIPTSHKSK